jgi:hypothetical protein
VSEPPVILHLDGEPIVVKPGPITTKDRQRIERAVGLTIPPGKQFVALAILDKQSGQPVEGGFGAAWRSKNDRWKLAGEVRKQWGGDLTGMVGVVYSR